MIIQVSLRKKKAFIKIGRCARRRIDGAMNRDAGESYETSGESRHCVKSALCAYSVARTCCAHVYATHSLPFSGTCALWVLMETERCVMMSTVTS